MKFRGVRQSLVFYSPEAIAVDIVPFSTKVSRNRPNVLGYGMSCLLHRGNSAHCTGTSAALLQRNGVGFRSSSVIS